MTRVDSETLAQLRRIDRAARALFDAKERRAAPRTLEARWLDLEAVLFSSAPSEKKRDGSEEG